MPGKLIICRGLPGSGKSTTAKKYVQEQVALGNLKVMNVDRDAIRMVNGFGITPGPFENTVTAIRDSMIREGLRKNFTVIESSTNLRSKYVRDLMQLAEFYGSEVEFWDFKEATETCISRDAIRGKSGGHSVGARVILNMHDRFLKNGWPKVPDLKPSMTYEPYVPDLSLPKTIIVDIDGTIAETNRDPYDYSKVGSDLPKGPVINAVKEWYAMGYKIVFMSGRPDSCRTDTVTWLNKYVNISEYELFMRTTGDQRPDYIVKAELFDKNVRHRCNVARCVDDRLQVIRMYRDLGLTVFDVSGHTF